MNEQIKEHFGKLLLEATFSAHHPSIHAAWEDLAKDEQAKWIDAAQNFILGVGESFNELLSAKGGEA
jgi:hypothetical protein